MARPDLDYGTDISCTDDLNPNLTLVEGTAALAQALQRRLSTPRGRLYRYPDYGYDLRHRVAIEESTSETQRGIEAECLKDERAREARATVVLVDTYELAQETGRDIGTMLVTVHVDSSEGDLSFVLNVSTVTVELLELS